MNNFKDLFINAFAYGSIQGFSIIINVLRTKLFAVLLGPSGVGLLGLYQTTLQLIEAVVNLSIDRTAVRKVASSKKSINESEVDNALVTVLIATLITSVAGTVVVYLAADYMSRLTFGTNEHSGSLKVLGISVFFNVIVLNALAVFRGLGSIARVAKTTIYGSLFGLVISTVILYYYGVRGIVYVILSTSISSVVILILLNWKEIRRVKIDFTEQVFHIKELFKLGLAISVGTLTTIITIYYLRVLVRDELGVMSVGLYTAYFSIITTYFGLIFNSLSSDFLPRLSSLSISSLNERYKLLTNQINLSLIGITPLALFLLMFSGIIIRTLYTDQFAPIGPLLEASIYFVILKSISWPIGVLFMAYDRKKHIVIVEIVGGLINIIASTIFIYYVGLMGLVYGAIISQIFHLIYVTIIARVEFDFEIAPSTLLISILSLVQYAGVYYTKNNVSSYGFVIELTLLASSIAASLILLKMYIDKDEKASL